MLENLINFYKTCKYGLINRQNNSIVLDSPNVDYFNLWKLNKPSETLNYHIGICYDTVALTKHILDHKFPNTNYKIFFSCSQRNYQNHNYNDSTHTFLIYKDNNIWKWLEGSWQNYKNNNIQFQNDLDLVNYIAIKLANLSKLNQLIFQINNFPKYHTNFENFSRIMLSNNIVMKVNYDKAIDNIKNDIVYHGSPLNLKYLDGSFVNKFSNENNAVFVSPFKAIASCFCINKNFIIEKLQLQNNNIDLANLNFNYSIWNQPYDKLLNVPDNIQILLNINNFKPFKGSTTGFLYVINMKDYYNKYHKFNKNMDSDVEFIIQDKVDYIHKMKLKLNYYVVPQQFQYYKNQFVELNKGK